MSDKTPLAKAKAKYELEKRGKVVVKVALSSSDDPAEWQAITDDCILFSTAKTGAGRSGNDT